MLPLEDPGPQWPGSVAKESGRMVASAHRNNEPQQTTPQHIQFGLVRPEDRVGHELE